MSVCRYDGQNHSMLNFGQYLAGIWRQTTILQIINLSNACSSHLESFLGYNGTVTELLLQNLLFNSNGIQDLSNGLAFNDTIQKITICHTRFSIPMIQNLNLNRSTIKNVSLIDCRIDGEMVNILLNSVLSLSSIVRLYLTNNEITDQGLQLLINALPKCVRLEYIGLSGNFMTNASLLSLIEIIPRCPSIKDTDIGERKLIDVISTSRSTKVKVIVYLLSVRHMHVVGRITIPIHLIREIFLML